MTKNIVRCSVDALKSQNKTRWKVNGIGLNTDRDHNIQGQRKS